MYAVIADRGKQFCVEEGQRILVDLRTGEAGQDVEFERVLLIADGTGKPRIGRPIIDGAKVVGKLTGQVAGPKIHVQFYKRRKNYRRHIGHRQRYTEVEITKIVVP
jgi:large subunit ribosomal protein L21